MVVLPVVDRCALKVVIYRQVGRPVYDVVLQLDLS